MLPSSEVVRAARGYIGTPYRHQGRRKGMGLDCVGLVLCVGEELGIVDKTGTPFHRYLYSDYSRQPTGEELQEECILRLVVKRTGTPATLDGISPGDLLTVRVPTVITHVAIVAQLQSGALSMIHSYSGVRKVVVENSIDFKWMRRIAGVFSFPGVC